MGSGRQGRDSATTYAGICLVLLAIAHCSLIAATTYNVGGTAGWDLNVDYKAWAAKNNFKVGDTLVFKYPPGAHSVFQVSEANLKACNLTSPLKAYLTGDDSVVLTQATTYYFICGVPGHCTLGMDVTIPVSEAGSSSSAPSPAPAVSPAAPPKVSATPSPQNSEPSRAPAPASSSPSPSITTPSPSPSGSSPSPNSPSSTSPSPSPATSTSPPNPQSPPVSSTPSSSTIPPPPAAAPSPPKNAASALPSGSLALLSAVLLGGFLLIFH